MALLASLSNILDSKQQKDTQVPPEILTVVEELKKYLAEQKKIRDEVAKTSNKQLDDLSTELQELQRSVTCNLSGLRRQNVKSSHLSEEILQLERNTGIIQRSLDMSSDFAQNSPEINEYFKNCISSFSNRVQTYKQEVLAIENSLSSRAKSNLTPKELSDILRKLDDTFMSLAAQLYSLNEQLSVPKAHILRQYQSLDSGQIIESSTAASMSLFDEILFESEKKSANTPYGPSPFSSVTVTTGAQAATATSGLPSLGLVTQQPSTVTTSSSAFSLSALKPSSGASSFSLGGTTTASALSSTGFSLGGLGAKASTSTPSTAFSFGSNTLTASSGTTTTNSTGFGLSTASGQLSTGFGFGTSLTATPTTTASTGFGFGTGNTGTSIFGSPATKPSLFGSK
nr:nucleoporin p58:p45 [Hymenolepis microstoma]